MGGPASSYATASIALRIIRLRKPHHYVKVEIPSVGPRRRWEDNIKMDLRETGWEGVDWIHLAQDMDQWRAVVNTVMNSRVP
jgi:hypothetical protein